MYIVRFQIYEPQLMRAKMVTYKPLRMTINIVSKYRSDMTASVIFVTELLI